MKKKKASTVKAKLYCYFCKELTPPEYIEYKSNGIVWVYYLKDWKEVVKGLK